jgi:hypothetical protein
VTSKLYICVMHTLVFEGGADKTVAYIGVLAEISAAFPGWRNRIKRVHGTSAGAIIAIMFAMGIPEDEMPTIVAHFSQNHYKPPMLDALDMAEGLWHRLGVVENSTYVGEFVRHILKSKWDIEACTLKEFADRCGMSISITVANISDAKTEELDERTHPSMDLQLAICMTTCIPLLFEPICHRDKLYVDGALYHRPLPANALVICAECCPSIVAPGDDLVTYMVALLGGLVHRRAPADAITVKFDGASSVLNGFRDVDSMCSFLDLTVSKIDDLVRRGHDAASAQRHVWTPFLRPSTDAEQQRS